MHCILFSVGYYDFIFGPFCSFMIFIVLTLSPLSLPLSLFSQVRVTGPTMHYGGRTKVCG